MKKFFMISALLAMVSGAFAENSISVGTTEVFQGGLGYIEVKYNFDQEDYFANYSFDLYLPDGITLNESSIVKGDCHSENHPKNYTINENDGFYSLAMLSNPTTALTGTSGVLVKLAVNVDSKLALDSEHQGAIRKIRFASTGGSTTTFKDVEFTIKVVENRITFDEQATELPSATGLQNVLVKRAIKANQWNTICLPFAMTAEQVAKAFGEAQLADFTGCTPDYPEGANYATSIKVNFQSVTEMAANRPYLIKVANPVTYADGFKVDGVTIEPSESLVNEQDKDSYTKYGKTYYTFNSFIGTYFANTEIPGGSIILSGNKFYYTKGTTTKGFRGWFYFENCALNDIDLATAEVKIFVDDVTAIDGIGFQRIAEGVYDLSGRKIQLENGDLNKLQKGVYIIDGKKVTIK